MPIIDVDPLSPWPAELLARPLAPGQRRLVLDEEDFALVEIGRMVDALIVGGWAGLGRLWRTALQRDVLRLVEEHGAGAITPALLRGIVSPEPPPSRLLPYQRAVPRPDGTAGVEFRLLPQEQEDRFVGLVETETRGGWCGWTPAQRAGFLGLLTRVLKDKAPEDVPDDWVRVLIAGIERASVRMAS